MRVLNGPYIPVPRHHRRDRPSGMRVPLLIVHSLLEAVRWAKGVEPSIDSIDVGFEKFKEEHLTRKE